MNCKNLSLKNPSLTLVILLAVFATSAFAGSRYQVIHRFQEAGNIGVNPTVLIADNAGNLYGATNFGIYQLTPPGTSGGAWNTNLIYSPGSEASSLVLDQAGNLYGVNAWQTSVVFKLTPPKDPASGWTATILYVFKGEVSAGGLVLDREGNLYGTTSVGGRGCPTVGCGTIFKLTPSSHGKAWTRTVLYYFKGVPGDQTDGDGEDPIGVVFDPKGNLYGTTARGGHCDQFGCYGTAFELRPPKKKGGRWTERVLYRFNLDDGYCNGDVLNSGVVLDKSGALYGSTDGSVYQLTLVGGVWTETILALGCYEIYSGVVLDQAGNVYGTIFVDGANTNGTVFKLSPPGKGSNIWTETVLHAFAGGLDGSGPFSGVTFGFDGALYGTTLMGGNNQCKDRSGDVGCGTVFRVAP